MDSEHSVLGTILSVTLDVEWKRSGSMLIRPRDEGEAEHLKVFAADDVTEKWFREHDPEGVAFEYEVLN